MTAITPLLTEFPKNGRPWRIDGVGRCIYPTGSRGDPLVEVFLSELAPGFSNELSNASPTGKGTVAHVKIGKLALLKHGSIWLDHARMPHKSSAKTASFDLASNQFDLVHYDSLITVSNESRQMLGPQQFFMSSDSQQGLAKSWVAVVKNPLPDIEFAVIPCSVIFQACLATSPAAIRRLAWGELSRVVSAPKWIQKDSETKALYVEVAKNIRSDEAYAHANLYVDPVGKREYSRFRNGLRLNSVNPNSDMLSSPRPTFIHFGLPFANLVHLEVQGKYLPIGAHEKKRWGFLVTQINSMRTKLVFDSLIVHRKNDASRGENCDADDLKEIMWPSPSPCPIDPEAELALPTHSDDDPLDSLDALCIEEAGGFLAEGLELINDPKLTQEYKRKKGESISGQFDGTGTTGDTRGGATGAVGLDIDAKPTPSTPVTLMAFVKTLALLRRQGYGLETIAVANITSTINDKDVVNFLPRKLAGVRRWHFVSDAINAPTRGYIVARLHFGGVWHHFIELERKGEDRHSLAHIRRNDGQLIEAQQLAAFMREVARSGGWSAITARPQWRINRIKHSPTQGIEHFAQDICEALGMV